MAQIRDGKGTTNQMGVDAVNRAYSGLYDPSGTPVSTSNPLPVASSPPADAFTTLGAITATDTATTTATGFNNQPITTGTPSANSFVQLALTTAESLHVQALGSFTAGQLFSEFSIDGGVTFFRQVLRISGTSTLSSSISAPFAGLGNLAGKSVWRLRAGNGFTGNLTVKVSTSANQGGVYVVNAIQLADATAAVMAAIKSASTAAAAADPALVVALSPNSNTVNVTSLPLPAGAATESGNLAGILSKLSGTINVANANSSTATITSVNASTSAVALLAANAGRKGVYLTNDSTSVVYVALGATASTTLYTFALPPKTAAPATYEMPDNTIFTGSISAVWAAANGAMRITELG